jgi:hypothetical protein
LETAQRRLEDAQAERMRWARVQRGLRRRMERRTEWADGSPF